MSLILDALRKAQSERKTIFVNGKKRAINMGNQDGYFLYPCMGPYVWLL
jgi:hypothetical protein